MTNLNAKVITNQLRSIKVNILVNGNHHAQHEESLDNLVYLALNQLGKLLHIDGFTNFYIGRTNNFCRSSCGLRRVVGLTVAVHRHLMPCTAVRTAFLSSIGALNLRLFLAALACIAAFFATGQLCSSFGAAFAAVFVATCGAGCVHATAFTVHCLAGLLTFRANKNTTLTLIIIATVLALAIVSISLLAIATILALAVIAVALRSIIITAILVLTAIVTALLNVIIALTIFRAALLAIVALILIVLLHIPLTVFIIILLFGLFLLHSLCLTQGFLLLFRFRCRLGRFRLLIVCITNHSHHLFISATKILLLKIMLLEQI